MVGDPKDHLCYPQRLLEDTSEVWGCSLKCDRVCGEEKVVMG